VLRAEARTALGALALDVALEVPAGACLALAGPSGAGKSSVLRVVAGLLRPRQGRVRCGDDVWLDTGRGVDLPPERRRCGYVFQDYALFGHLRAWQNVAYGLRDLPRAARRARADELLDRFGVGHLAESHPRTLSGGERQRVALARALARRPAAILLDEPLSALDARTRARAGRELVAILREAAVPSVVVTHDFTEAALLADRVSVVDAGRVVQHGTPAALAAEPTTAFVADFTGAVVLTGVARAGGGGLTLVDLDGGGTVASTQPARGPVAVSVFPWEIAVGPPDRPDPSSAQNHVPAEVLTITAVGNRVRVGLAGPQPFSAEITQPAAQALGLRPGARVTATWKAAATRLLQL
jgi:molybdate transport system ATP-binding protein